MNMSYSEACNKVGKPPQRIHSSTIYPKKELFSPKKADTPPDLWLKAASSFACNSHQSLLNNLTGLRSLQERGFSLSSLETFLLGWNPEEKTVSMQSWGLAKEIKEDGKERKIWLPKGIVIPSFSNGTLIKLKVRRAHWSPESTLPKYIEIVGNMKCPSFYGNINSNVIILVEAELDAMLIQQYASDICCCLAIGGAGKKPDLDSHMILQKASVILFALDFDAAGNKAFHFWKDTYPHLRAWPIPFSKSPGDALKLGVNLRKWVSIGIEQSKSSCYTNTDTIKGFNQTI